MGNVVAASYNGNYYRAKILLAVRGTSNVFYTVNITVLPIRRDLFNLLVCYRSNSWTLAWKPILNSVNCADCVEGLLNSLTYHPEFLNVVWHVCNHQNYILRDMVGSPQCYSLKN